MNATFDSLKDQIKKTYTIDATGEPVRIILGKYGVSTLSDLSRSDYPALQVDLDEWLEAHKGDPEPLSFFPDSRDADDGPNPTGEEDADDGPNPTGEEDADEATTATPQAPATKTAPKAATKTARK